MSGDDNSTRLRALLGEQAALRRVATMVAGCTPAPALFGRVCEELGVLLAVKSADMIRYEDGRSATVVGSWAASGTPSFPVGERIPVDGETVTAKLYRSGRPERVDDYVGVEGELAEKLREFGIRSVVGAPMHVPGRLWGAVMVTSELPSAFGRHRGADRAALPSSSSRRSPMRTRVSSSPRRRRGSSRPRTPHAGVSSATFTTEPATAP